MKILRPATEAEVLAEFLRAEFYQKEYDHDRQNFEALVLDPNVKNEAENAVRRALLYRRRGHMWRELPADTNWFEVQIEEEDMPKLRVFPRAQWRTICYGSFQLSDIVERIKRLPQRHKVGPVVAKIQLLRYRLQREGTHSTVLLIGIDEHRPMTILEGNHRLAAAMLISPKLARLGFRVLCGFSPRMAESCWYHTSFSNLRRYLKHRLANIHDREADVRRVLAEQQLRPATGYTQVATAAKLSDIQPIGAAIQDSAAETLNWSAK